MLNSRKQFSLLLAVLLLSGFAVTSWLSYQVAHDTIEAQITQETLPLTSDNIYSEIQHDLFRPIFVSSLMAQDTFVRDWTLAGEKNPTQLIKYLNEIQDKYNTITSYFISDISHKYYHASGVLRTISEDDPSDSWYLRVKQLPSEQDYEINIDRDTPDHSSAVVFVNYKVFDYEGNFIGITGVGLALDAVKNLIEIYQTRYQRKVYFIDTLGQVALHGKEFEGSTDIRQRSGINKFATRILTSPSNSFNYQSEGYTVFVNSRMVEEFDWYLIVEQHAASNEQKLADTFKVNLLLSLIMTVIVLLVAHVTFNKYQRRLENMATIDKLSGVLNRQAFDLIFDQSLNQAKRKQSSLSVILLDIDNFKRVNDTFGHLVGDKVIQKVAHICQLHSRDCDVVCRWGGEEFLILLNGSDTSVAKTIALRIQEYLANDISKHAVTASFGIAQYQLNESTDSLLSRTDDALYKAKDQGRNCIVVAGLPSKKLHNDEAELVKI